MDDSNDFLIDKLMEFIREENIDDKLLFYSSILERLMDKKEKMDKNIKNINTSVRHRACKKPMRKLKLDFLELISDEDSSSDYEPSEIDSDDEDSDDDDEV